jgi:hypothetical protein
MAHKNAEQPFCSDIALQTSIVPVDDRELRAAMVAHGYCGEHTGILRGHGDWFFGHKVVHGRVRLGTCLDGPHDIHAPQETAQAIPVIKQHGEDSMSPLPRSFQMPGGTEICEKN